MSTADMDRRMRRRARGYSLVELLVVLVASLVLSLAVFRIFISFEGYRRTTTAGNDALMNGAAALQLLAQEIETAGYGIVMSGALGCTVNARKSGTNYSFPLVPVLITNQGASDRIAVLYSTKPAGSAVPVVTTAAHPASVHHFRVANTQGYAENDFIVAYEAGKACALVQLTAITTDTNNPNNNRLIHASGTNPYNHQNNDNFPPGNPDGYSSGASLLNLGAMRAVRFEVDANGRLIETNTGENSITTPIPLADGIVAIRAQYGLDTASDNNVDVYVNPRADGRPDHSSFTNGTNAAQIDNDWRRVLSIRVAVVVRSGLREKNPVSPASLTLWPSSATGAPATAGPTYTVPDQNYRYKIFETIIPIRNVIWKS